MQLEMININKIHPNPLQPRQSFDREKLQELANSIKESDLLEPIIVKKNGDNYEIVAGERRWKAFQILKRSTMPAIVWNIKDDIEALEKGLIENLQRDDLTSIERENAIHELWVSKRYATKVDLAKKLGISHQVISDIIGAKEFRDKVPVTGISTEAIKNTAGLPDETREKILLGVSSGKIDASKIREVVRAVREIPDKKTQVKIIGKIEDGTIGTDKIRTYVSDVKKMPEPIRKAVIEEEVEYERVKPRLEVGIPEEMAEPLVKELKKEQAEEESRRRYHEEVDKAILEGDLDSKRVAIKRPEEEERVEKIKNLYRQVTALAPVHFEQIKYDKYRDEAIEYLKRMEKHCRDLLISLGEIELGGTYDVRGSTRD